MLIIAAAALALVAAISRTVAIGVTPTSSMEPTIHCVHTSSDVLHYCLGSTGSIFLIDKLAYTFSGPHYSDIVSFKPTAHYLATCADRGDGDNYVKRVIGLPGDHLLLGKDGVLRRNGITVNEPYRRAYVGPHQTRSEKRLFALLTRAQRTGGMPFAAVVPAGEVFVVGDFRDASCDSRTAGAIPLGSIIGKVTLLGQPPASLCSIPLLDAICDRPHG